MISDPSGRRYPALVLAAALVGGGLAGCGLLGRAASPEPATPVAEDPPTERTSPPLARPACPPAGTRDPSPVAALLAYYGSLRGSAELASLRARALAAPGEDAFARICQAMVLGMPGNSADLPRARALLGAVLAADGEDALAVRALVHLLLDNVLERERLGRLHERLDARLQASEQARAALQKKLEELTEIERSLPPPPAPDATLPSPAGPAPWREVQ